MIVHMPNFPPSKTPIITTRISNAIRTILTCQLFFSAKAKVKDEGQESTISIGKAYKSGDFAFPVGVSYEFFGKLILDARYNIGVVNVVHDNSKIHNNAFALTVGYRF